MTSAEVGKLIVENWQMVFIYGLKILDDTNKNIRNLDKIVAVHDAEMKILKEDSTICKNRRAEE